jgi:ABC-type branched-subunit amino acid transport system ATPase component
MNILEIQHLYRAFDGVRAINDLSLSVSSGTVTSIIGSNGAGKTTLFNLINGFIRQEKGTIRYKGISIDALRAPRRAQLGIGRLWQDIRLFGKMTVLDNLLVARKLQPGESIVSCLLRPKRAAKFERSNRDNANDILALLGLKDKANSLAQNLSYGQQKLVAIGRLLSNDAELLLLDEPTAGVHPSMIEEVLSVIARLAAEGKTILMIEHNIPKARLVSDLVYVMDNGKIELSKRVQEKLPSR